MRIQEHRASFVANTDQQVANFATPNGVDSIGWFVEYDELWIIHQRCGQSNTLSHSLGVRTKRSIFPSTHSNTVKQFACAFLSSGSIDLRHRAAEFHDLSSSQICRKAVVFWQVSNSCKCDRVADGTIQDSSLHSVGSHDCHHYFDERAFSRAVGTKKSENFSRPNLKCHALQRANFSPVCLVDIGQVDCQIISRVDDCILCRNYGSQFAHLVVDAPEVCGICLAAADERSRPRSRAARSASCIID